MKTICYVTGFCFLVCFIMPLGAQTVKRYSISSYGAIPFAGNSLIGQTAGQPFQTISTFENETSFLQGFQQPVSFKIEVMENIPMRSLNFSVFPNPARQSVTMQSNDRIENVSVLITDMSGRFVFSERLSILTHHEINCDTWKPGVYFISVSDESSQIQTLKLIISK